ncbi:MAG: hypothetical protein ACC635_05500, partial [Acidiferrobacterales bacterium]
MQATRQQKQLFLAALTVSLSFWSGLSALVFFELANFRLLLEKYQVSWQLLLAAVLVVLLITIVINAVIRIQRLAYLRGFAVELGPNQYPDLFKRVKSVCKRLGIENEIHSYLLNRARTDRFNSLRVGRKLHVVLPADSVGILTDRQGSIDFLIGFEIAKLIVPHSKWSWLLWPSTVFPLINAARKRMELFRCDGIALAACKSQVDAALALAMSVAGDPRWISLNIPEFNKQNATISGFTMSLAELLSDTPWASKRMANLRALATKSDAFIPRYHPISYLVAVLFPFIQPLKLVFLSQILILGLWVIVAGYWAPIAKSFVTNQIELRWPGENKNSKLEIDTKTAATKSTSKNKR